MAWNTPKDWQTALDDVGMTDHFKTMEVPASVDDLLGDANWEVIFHQYTKAEFSSENVEFLRAVAAFEASPSHENGLAIYNQYVSESAATQVNISGAQRKPIDEIFGEHAEEGEEEGEEAAARPQVTAETFAVAKNEITRMMAKDTFPRFKASAIAAQTGLNASEDWDAVATRGRAGGSGDAPLPEGHVPPPPPLDADEGDVPPPPPHDGDDDVPPPPPADADAGDVPPPPPPGPSAAPASDVPPPPPPPPPLDADEDVPPPPPVSPAP